MTDRTVHPYGSGGYLATSGSGDAQARLGPRIDCKGRIMVAPLDQILALNPWRNIRSASASQIKSKAGLVAINRPICSFL